MPGPKSYLFQIQDYFEGRTDELDYDAEEYLERLQSIMSMMREARSTRYINKAMKKTHGLSRAQIYKARSDAQILFGDINKLNVDIARHIAMENAQYAMRLARKAKNSKDLTAAVQAYAKAAGLHLNQAEMPDMSKVQAPPVVVALPAGTKELLQALTAGGAINLNEIPTPLAIEDIEYEEDGAEQ